MKQKAKSFVSFLSYLTLGILIGLVSTNWVFGQSKHLIPAHRIELPPVTSPTEAAPQFHLDITITNSQTGQPVRANVFLGEAPSPGEEAPAEMLVEVCHQVNKCQLTVDGRSAHTSLNLQIHAPGYEPFSITMRHNLERSRTLVMPVKLIPAQPKA